MMLLYTFGLTLLAAPGSARAKAWAARPSLHEAADLSLVVGALYQVDTYRALLPTLMGNGADDGLANGDLSWLKRSLTYHELGLESPA